MYFTGRAVSYRECSKQCIAFKRAFLSHRRTQATSSIYFWFSCCLLKETSPPESDLCYCAMWYSSFKADPQFLMDFSNLLPDCPQERSQLWIPAPFCQRPMQKELWGPFARFGELPWSWAKCWAFKVSWKNFSNSFVVLSLLSFVYS